MRNKIILMFIFLLGLSYATPFTYTSLKCNSYSYSLPSGANYVAFYLRNVTAGTSITIYSIGATCGGAWNNCLRFNNSGYLDQFTDYYSAPVVLIEGSTYYVNATTDSINWWHSDDFTPPFYQGCSAPTLDIVNSYPSTIMTDRYRLNFTLSNTAGWSNIQCSLTLNGTNLYTATFTTNGSVDVLYSIYPKSFTIARVICIYNDQNDNTLTFADQQFLLDSSRTYSIYDAQKNLGRASTDPNFLTPSSALAKLKFYVLSSPDREDYLSDLMGSLTTSVNPISLNCTGVNNYTTIYLSHTINDPPYSITLQPNWICDSPTTIPVTLTLTDINSGSQVATATFNIVWGSGSMVIDNINLIENTNNFNLELWATVSNLFTHAPIPTSSNLACNYSMTSQNYTTFTGDMGVYLTNSSNGTLEQTDAYNISIDLNSSFQYRDRFNIQINCSANNYTSASVSATRWIAAKRLKTFQCSIINPPFDNYIFYSDPYHTQGFTVACRVVLDTDINSEADDIIINNWLPYTTSLHLNLHTNYRANDIGAACPELKNLDYILSVMSRDCPTCIPTTAYYSLNVYEPITAFYSELGSCTMTPIDAGLITNNLVEFNVGDSYNDSTWNYYPYTTAVLAFNMTLTQSQVSRTILAIANTKTSNVGIVETGDILTCITTATDPYNNINMIDTQIGEVNTETNTIISTCDILGRYSIGLNNTKTGSATVSPVSPSTCPFMSGILSLLGTGKIQCIAKVYYKNQADPVLQYSNILPYVISVSPANYNLTENCTNDWRDYFNPNCIGNTNATGGGLAGMLLSNPTNFILMVGLFIISMPLILVIARNAWSKNNKGGA